MFILFGTVNNNILRVLRSIKATGYSHKRRAARSAFDLQTFKNVSSYISEQRRERGIEYLLR